MDYIGENDFIKKACKEWYLGIKFEFSDPRTSKRNVKVEIKFQTLYGSIRSMINDARIKEIMRRGIWAACASTATFYANTMLNREYGNHLTN
jgi:hypothetical protein